MALDLGSRDGEVALYLHEHYPHAEIYAFECNPEAITLVRKNVQGVPGVTLVERAVSDMNGTLDFFAIDPDATITPHADGNIGASSLYQANPDYPFENYAQRRISVESIRLAREHADDVEWSAEDATRSDIDFLARCVKAAIEAGATSASFKIATSASGVAGADQRAAYAAEINQLIEQAIKTLKQSVASHLEQETRLERMCRGWQQKWMTQCEQLRNRIETLEAQLMPWMTERAEGPRLAVISRSEDAA